MFRDMSDIDDDYADDADVEDHVADRQACSSQILYLSKSTKITTNTETAMLSSCG